MKLKITAKDIAQGKAFDCTACPIALSARRGLRLRKSTPISVESIGIFVGPNERIRYRYFGRKAVEFMHNFDRGLHVEPITFSIRRAR